MLDAVLHTGAEHPDLVRILVPSVLSFVAGLGIGESGYPERLRGRLSADEDATTD
ncbi:hypothetical protein ACFQGT_16035 [Natrialbaceae archaeon GCM10025810]|uniref:hypothetical protein n=1 Tax=Halovalidus salilacus TaxID=3075124 RepID=UPI003615D75B